MRIKYFVYQVLTTYLLFFFQTAFSQTTAQNNSVRKQDSALNVRCREELSNMTEFMKVGLPDYARSSWRYLFNNCPSASKNIYISGARIFSGLIENTNDPKMKNAYFDTLMMVYDQRIKYFGEAGYVLGRKGKDIITYNSSEFDKAYEAFKESVSLFEFRSDPGILVGLMETSLAMYRQQKIQAEEFLKDYLLTTDKLDNIVQVRNPVAYEKIYKRENQVLLRSNITDCSQISHVFQSRLDTVNTNLYFLQGINDLLENSGCNQQKFFLQVEENLFQLQNTPDRAFEISKYYLRNEDFQNSFAYLLKAANLESDTNKLSNYYYQMAYLANTKLNQSKDAVKYARKVIELKPSWGEPYFLIASAYVNSVNDCSDDPFTRSTIYWLAADECIKASSADPASVSKANDLLRSYQAYFPNKEDLFFRSLTEGTNYSVKAGWISANTKVRARK